MYMIIKLEDPTMGIYMYQSVTRNFASAFFVHQGSTLRNDLPNEVQESGSLKVLILTIDSALDRVSPHI